MGCANARQIPNSRSLADVAVFFRLLPPHLDHVLPWVFWSFAALQLWLMYESSHFPPRKFQLLIFEGDYRRRMQKFIEFNDLDLLR